jgi:choline dehydrogenase-like flavoprotein
MSELTLTPRQRRSLAAICDTFCPAGDGLLSASELGVPEAVLTLVARDPRPGARRELRQLLSAWDAPALTYAIGHGWKRFTALPVEKREAALLSWGDSAVPQRRAAFHALRKGALLMYYALPAPGGRPNPVWDAVGFPGPPGPAAGAPPRALSPLAPARDTSLDCDVCIVGSGAGGGVAAAVLSGAGLDVVVLEGGGYYDDADFDGGELNALTRIYAGSPTATHDQSVGLIAGACLGGGTVVNYSTSFRTPDDVRAEWAAHGVPAFAGAEFSASLDAVCDRLGVNQEHNDPSTRDQKLRDGCLALGWHVDAMPRNVDGRCDQGVDCGRCGLGCRRGAKQSVVKTWLKDADAAGARLLVGTTVDRVRVEQGSARGVEARTAEGHRVTVRARAVVVACGALHTPALLRRSGLQNQHIGRHLKLHPATAVWGVYDDELRPWEGTMQALYSDQHRRLDGGYGVKYETAAALPHLAVPFFPWRGSGAHHELMQGLSSTVAFGVLLRDRDGGEVRVGRDGQPLVRYRLSRYDLGHVRAGIEGAARMHEAAGARRVFSSQSRFVSYMPGAGAGGADAAREQFMREVDACGYGAGRTQFASFHIMGSARMGGAASTSAVAPSGETWDVRDLYVFDGAAFPSAPGVNPQVSIQAIAHMGARRLAARLG